MNHWDLGGGSVGFPGFLLRFGICMCVFFLIAWNWDSFVPVITCTDVTVSFRESFISFNFIIVSEKDGNIWYKFSYVFFLFPALQTFTARIRIWI